MAGKEIIEISEQQKNRIELHKIDETTAHAIIATKKQVLMIFQRPENNTYFGYYASEITDLNHAKKVQLVNFEWFFNIEWLEWNS